LLPSNQAQPEHDLLREFQVSFAAEGDVLVLDGCEEEWSAESFRGLNGESDGDKPEVQCEQFFIQEDESGGFPGCLADIQKCDSNEVPGSFPPPRPFRCGDGGRTPPEFRTCKFLKLAVEICF